MPWHLHSSFPGQYRRKEQYLLLSPESVSSHSHVALLTDLKADAVPNNPIRDIAIAIVAFISSTPGLGGELG